MKRFMRMLLMIVIVLSLAQSVMAQDQAGIIIENGTTDVITYFTLRDRTASTVDVGVTVANLEMYYIEDQTAESGDAFVGAHGAETDAHTDGECFHIGHGVYRIDWPDAAFDGGIGKRVTLIVVDGDAGAFTSTMQVDLSPPVDSVLIDSNDVTAANLHEFFGNVGANDAYEQFEDMYDSTGYAGGTIKIETDVQEVDGVAAAATTMETFFDVSTAADNLHDFFSNATAYGLFDDMFDGTTISIASCWSDALAASDITDDWESQSQADPTGFEVNLKEINDTVTQLEMLMDLTTSINADADLTSIVVDKSVLSHIMTLAADTSAYKASTDSLQGSKDTLPAAVWAVALSDLAAGAPSATASALTGLNWLYEAWRNKTVTATVAGGVEVRLYKNDAATIAAEADASDDGVDFTRGEYGAED